jgi:hypothetical protein
MPYSDVLPFVTIYTDGIEVVLGLCNPFGEHLTRLVFRSQEQRSAKVDSLIPLTCECEWNLSGTSGGELKKQKMKNTSTNGRGRNAVALVQANSIF